MDAKMILSFAALLLCTGLTLVNCQSQPDEVPVVTTMVPDMVNEGEDVTLVTVFNVTVGNQTCKPQDLQLLGGMYFPDNLIADFTNLFVDDYRLRVSLDTRDEHVWVYNLTVSCVTRLNNTHFLYFAGTWSCPGIDVIEQCYGLPIKVNFSSTDALPVCAGQPTGVNATAPGEPRLPRRAHQGYNTVRDITSGGQGMKDAAKPPMKICHISTRK